jgi:TatD DNase family protein
MQPLPKDRRNEPAFLTFVLRGISACRDESTEEIAEATSATARTFFRLEDNN